jgi:mono/diheme cytochrome c family protein
MWAGWYLSEFDGNFRNDAYDGPNAFRNAAVSDASSEEVQIDPMLLGKRIYTNCVSCHQTSGQGIAGQYPPLVDSEWVLGSDRVLARILLNGIIGPIEVRGKVYNAQMPAWRQLSDRDIAAVLTYIRASWGNTADPVSEATIQDVRAKLGGRTKSFTAAELLDIAEASASENSLTATSSDATRNDS